MIAPGRVLTNAHNLRHDEATVTFADGRQASPAASLGSDGDLDLAVIDVDTGDVEPVDWPEDATSRTDRAAPCWRSPTPADAACASRRDSCPRPRAASAARAAAAVAGAIEHTAPLPARLLGRPAVDVDGRLLGINAVRVDGGLILAIPADGALRERVEALGRGEAPEAGAARRRDRAAARRAHGCAARSACPSATACWSAPSRSGSAADRAGLERGDLIVAAGGQRDRPRRRAVRGARRGAGQRHARADDRARHRRARRSRSRSDGRRRWPTIERARARRAREREAEALDAYSRVVVDVAERLAPSVANLRVMRRGAAVRCPPAPAAPSRSRPTGSC